MKKSSKLNFILLFILSMSFSAFPDGTKGDSRKMDRILKNCKNMTVTEYYKDEDGYCFKRNCEGGYDDVYRKGKYEKAEVYARKEACLDEESSKRILRSMATDDDCAAWDIEGNCVKKREGSSIGNCLERNGNGDCIRHSVNNGYVYDREITAGCGPGKCVKRYKRNGKPVCRRTGHSKCLVQSCTSQGNGNGSFGDCINKGRLSQLARNYNNGGHNCGPNCRNGRGGGFGAAMEGIGKFLMYGGIGASQILGPIMWRKGVADISAAAQVGFQQCASVQNNYITSYLGGWADNGTGTQVYQPGYLQQNSLPDRPLDIPGCNGYGIDSFAGLAGLGGGVGMLGLNGLLGAGYSPGMLGLGGLGGQIGLGGVIGTVISGAGGIGAGIAIGQSLGGLGPIGGGIGIAGPIGGGIGTALGNGIVGPIGGGIGIAGPIGGGIGIAGPIGGGIGIAGPIGGGIGIAGPIGGGIGSGFGIAGPIGGGIGIAGPIGGGIGNSFGSAWGQGIAIGGPIGGGIGGGGNWGGGFYPGGAGGMGLYPWGGANGFWGANGGFGNMWGNAMAEANGNYNAYAMDRQLGAAGIQAGNQFQWNMWSQGPGVGTNGYSPFNMFGTGNYQAGLYFP